MAPRCRRDDRGRATRCLLVLLLWSLLLPSRLIGAAAVPVILDTDLASDADDAAALAVLHGLADQGEAEIRAVMISGGNPWSPPCARALNSHYGRPHIPLGFAGERGPVDESSYAAAVGAGYEQPPPEDAVSLYRRVLAGAGDQGVVVISIGSLTNLGLLLASSPDAVSPEGGIALVRRTVRRLVSMGGQYPAGREWNFQRDPAATEVVLRDWPGPVLFCGFELGLPVVTGAGLKACHESHPLRRAYQLHNQLAGRPSWDQLTVLAAVRPDAPALGLEPVRAGRNMAAPDGGNRWLPGPDSLHAYARLGASPASLGALIESFMCRPPRGE